MVACADLDGIGGDPGCVFTALEPIVGVPDTLRCGIELESLLLIDVGIELHLVSYASYANYSQQKLSRSQVPNQKVLEPETVSL